MTKSKCEKQLERMTQERDHWRSKAEERAGRITDLERQLERAQIYGRSFANGIDGEIDRLQRERDNAVNMGEKIILGINALYRNVVTRRNEINEEIKTFTDSIESADNRAHTAMSRLLLAVAGETYNQATDIQERRITPLINHLATDHAPTLENIGKMLEVIGSYSVTIGIHHVMFNYVGLAYGHANDPRLIAYILLMECRIRGEPDLETIKRLPQEWIKEHLPYPPGSARRLQSGLSTAYKHITSENTQTKTALDNLITERELRKYLRWYEVIERFSAQTREEILPHLDFQLDAG